MRKPIRECRLRTYRYDGSFEERDDFLSVEAPLEIRIGGESIATTMRTPGHDMALAYGFLRSEGLIASAEDLASVAHCGRPGEEGYGNVVECLPSPGFILDPERLMFSRRGTLTSSSCGVCGRETIDDLLRRCGPVASKGGDNDRLRLSAQDVQKMLNALHAEQPVFERTGGLHAAALFGLDGNGKEAVVRAEDVGRHNAVDKVVGGAMLREADAQCGWRYSRALLVSGRVSFEIVQKAVAADVKTVVGISAPSSLAVELADLAQVTLIAFARDRSFNCYTHADRIRSA